MCAIAGFYKRGDVSNAEYMEKMLKSMHHRGPDNSDQFEDASVILGHNRLKIIDLSDDSNQPMLSDDGNLVLCFNGEIYNYLELKQRYDLRCRTTSDTEVVLRLYEKLGESFVHELNGMFAMAIYDKRSTEIRLWRDRFGIKPLYYHWDGHFFAFSSELKALLQLPINQELDLQAVGDYLFLEYIPKPKTAFKNFYKLENASMLRFRHDKPITRKYYHLSERLNQISISEKQALERFDELMSSSVKLRTTSDVPLGTLLSGGTDSTVVSEMLSRHMKPVDTFNLSFNQSVFEEKEYAEQVAQIIKSNHHTRVYDSTDLEEDVKEIFSFYDEPFAASSIFPSYTVCKMAKDIVTVALSGDGGDELFLGYGHHQWYKRFRLFEKPGGNYIRQLSYSITSGFSSPLRKYSNHFNIKSIKDDWPALWSADQYMWNEREISQLLGIDYQNESLRSSWEKIQSNVKDGYTAISLFDIENYLCDNLLYKMDIASMANSLEVRVPFLDHRLVEFSLSLPTSLKISGKDSKVLLKKHLEKTFPKNLVYRKKWGFSAPLSNWLDNDLKNLVNNNIIDIKNLPFETVPIEKKIKSYRAGNKSETNRIWSIVAFSEWKNNYLK